MVKKIEDAGGKVEAVYYGSFRFLLPLRCLRKGVEIVELTFVRSLSYISLASEGEGHGEHFELFL